MSSGSLSGRRNTLLTESRIHPLPRAWLPLLPRNLTLQHCNHYCGTMWLAAQTSSSCVIVRVRCNQSELYIMRPLTFDPQALRKHLLRHKIATLPNSKRSRPHREPHRLVAIQAPRLLLVILTAGVLRPGNRPLDEAGCGLTMRLVLRHGTLVAHESFVHQSRVVASRRNYGRTPC